MRQIVIAAFAVWCAFCAIAVGAEAQGNLTPEFPKADTIVEKVNPDVADTVETTSLGQVIPESVAKPHHFLVAIHVPTRKVAYAVSEGQKWAMTVGDTRGPWFDSVCFPVFHPDGSHVAYAARDDKKWCVVQGSQRGEAFDMVSVPVYSKDGKHLAYAAIDSRRQFVVMDGRVLEKHDRVMSHMVFSPDGSRLVYIVGDRDKSWVIAGDEKLGPYDEADDPLFSSDGRNMAYLAWNGGKVSVMLNGKQGPEVEGLPYHMVFSADAKRLAFAVAGDKTKNRIEVFDVAGDTLKAARTYGPLEVHVVRAEPLTNTTLTAAGWGPEFSPDDSTLVYGVNGGPRLEINTTLRTQDPGRLDFVLDTVGDARIDVNGKVAAIVRTDGILTPFQFSENGKEVRWLVLRDRELFEKRVRLR